LARELSLVDEVEYAVPDVWLHADVVAPDPHWPEQWNLGVGAGGIRAEAAWARVDWAGAAEGGPVVAVVDTGVLPHPRFAARLLPGYDFVADAANAHDGDGRDNDAADPGDWVGVGDCGLPQAFPSTWHGTHVAGLVAASSGNGDGNDTQVGMPGARLLPVRVLGRCGGALSDIVDAISWASGGTVPDVPANPTPAAVINLSLSGSGACAAPLAQAIAAAGARGALVVASAGNDSGDAGEHQPGNCADVLTVAAATAQGRVAAYSNTGPLVALAAPGGELPPGPDGWRDGVISTVNASDGAPSQDWSYASYQGTSQAAPHVSGVAAVLLAASPSLTPAQVRAALTQTARPLATPASGTGAGLVDAEAAVAAVTRQAPPRPAQPPTVTGVSPTAGPLAGGVVLVRGANLRAPLAVAFGGLPARVLRSDAASVSVLAPARSRPGEVPVSVTTSAGQSGPGPQARFGYRPRPVVSRVRGTAGRLAGGDVVTVAGSGLVGVTSVTFGASPARVLTRSEHALTVLTPRRSRPGAVAVRVSSVGGSSLAGRAATYRYLPAPSVRQVSRRWGLLRGGSLLVLRGTGLAQATSVRFGDRVAVVRRASATTLVVLAPRGARRGTVQVRVVTPGGVSAPTAAARFTYR
jgi:subtilisin family serine protease